jgi:hemolysin activation/secretion protein
MMKKNALLRTIFVLGMCLGMCGYALAQDATFDVLEYRVEGTTLLPAAAVEKAVYPFLGEKKALADVESAREALEKAYAEVGYLTVLVNLPPQKVDDGVVRLQVTEAPVDRLRVVESRYFSLGQIKAGVPSLAEGNVPNFNEMQDELGALNRSGDRRITPVLRPGKTPGTVEVDLKVQDSLPLHGNIELNNRYSQDTTPTRLNAGLRWDNLWDAQHSFGVQLQTVPEHPGESSVLSVNYNMPLASGNYLALYGVRADSNIAAAGTLSVLGKSHIYGARYIVQLPGASDFFQTATFGVDHKDISQSITLVEAGGFDTPIAYMPLTMGWDANWLGKNSNTKAGVAFNFHVRSMTGSEVQFDGKRYKGKPGYSYLRGSLTHNRTMEAGWGISARTTWQYTEQPLISNEQFSIGGADTVRGYLESAAAGDTGIALTLEASTPNFSKRLGESLDDLRLVAFVDSATVRVIEPLTAAGRYSLTGVGVGVRAKAWRGAVAELDWAMAMDEIGKTKVGDARMSFKLAYAW